MAVAFEAMSGPDSGGGGEVVIAFAFGLWWWLIGAPEPPKAASDVDPSAEKD